ncbi:MAG: hypothetical protein EBV86_01975 [Marivivens sp.]|nr:hypothetical protein [Marivivens sp.]NCW67324.1 hypothetical protein [Marivivens sp.]
MTAEKFFLKSKTIWGVIVMAIPNLLPLFGIGSETGVLITAAGDGLMQAAGAALAIYGRQQAGGLKIK